ncbi:MAG: acetate--CoA ligase [Patescibacteria group bacterium]|nr:acetate--CoA ligase [Patescibacteria group bacterium]
MYFPKPEIIENAYIKNYEEIYKYSINNPEDFWSNIAKELLWFKPWKKTFQWQYPYARWFVDGETNIIYNCLDRWLKTDKKNKLALIWIGQNLEVKKYTYQKLNEEVCKFANALKSLGVKKGDRVTIYLPKIPEQIISMLACAKIGAIHSVVYSGFSIDALKTRIQDAQAKIVITANSYPYKDKIINSFEKTIQAIKNCPSVENVVIVKRTNDEIDSSKDNISKIKFHFWNELISKQDCICSTQIMNANDPLFILYTSGTTGKPKGVIHGHGGYMVGVYATSKFVFDLKENDILFSTADPGWITGHSYMTYGPLLNGITTLIYESVPDYPHPGRWWEIIEKFKPTIFYTTPTAIRSLMKYGEEIPSKYDFSSLKILGSVGEPINPSAWIWFYKNIGRENKPPIMDTWWQTETGMHILTPLPSVPLKPGSCFKPFFGIMADVVDEKGKSVEKNKEGYLVLKTPWPSILLDLWQNSQKYKENYFEKIKNKTKKFIYFTGDSAKIDDDGYFWIIGRNDDVIKVSGHRLGSAEIESALVSNQKVAEAAVIGKPHEIKGESIKAFIILKHGFKPSEELKKELNLNVRMLIGPIASIDEIEFVEKLPKTRSGKIMRRVLKAQELGLPVGDISTLED